MGSRLNFLMKQWDRIWSQRQSKLSCPRRNRFKHAGYAGKIPAMIESLEQRSMLSASGILNTMIAEPTYIVSHKGAPGSVTPYTSATYNPSQISSAYGFNKISGNGSGQTIAIVDAYDDPTIQADLQTFDSRFSLASASLTVVSQTGSSSLPSTDPSKGWEVEESLDVEWAHALAPAAKIILVEANSASYADLFTAVQTAAGMSGVSVVSMSFGGGEFSSEASYNSVFTTPAGHQGVTFLASTGDNGAPGGFPAYSSNVVAVGGTSLTLDSSGNYSSESGWSGSGGGISSYMSQPSYQQGVVTQSTSMRTIPDVSFDADPNTGVYVCCSFTNGTSNPWEAVGGTSFSAPAWGALMSIIDQARVANGLGTLDGATQTLSMLYQLDKSTPSAFHDVTTGSNGNSAGTGYDLVTGIGSPVVNILVPAMSGGSNSSSNSKLAIQQSPTSGTAGVALGTFKVAIDNQSGSVVTSDTSTVTLTLSSGQFSTGSSTVTATAVNGVATFTSLVINATGTFTVTASDSVSSVTSATSSNLVIASGTLSSLTVQQKPTTGSAGVALSTIQIAALDSLGNDVTATTTVTLKLTGGIFSTGGTTVTATTSGGIATFSGLIINTAGTYSLAASAGSLSTSSFSVTVSTSSSSATKLAWQSLPPTTAVAGTSLGSIVVAVEDAYGNVVTSDTSTVTLTLSTGTFGNGSSTATATVSGGIATFSNLAINAVGTYQITASDSASSLTTVTSKNLIITPGALSSLVVIQNPTTATAGIAFLPAVKVDALDAYGNLISATATVTLTVTGTNFSTGSNTVTATASRGLASFGSLIINTAGTYTLAASVDSVTSSSFSLAVSPNVAKNPTWSSAPQSTAVAGATLSTIVVNVPDAYGNLVTTATTVTLKLTTGKFSTGSTLVTATSNNGVATFSGLSITTSGNYTLTAFVGSMASTASSLTVSPAAANKLVLTTAPKATAIAGTTLNNVVVAVEDTYGNIITTDSSTITLTLSSGNFSTGSNKVTATASGGVASFSSLAINVAGTYTITASDSVTSLTTATSGSLVINPGVLNSLVISQSPSTGTAGVALAPAIVVQALDAFGNLLSASTTVTLKLTSGKFSTGGTSATAATSSGVATFSNLIFNTSGSYTLTATVGTLSSSSFNVTISPAAASKLAWQSSPPTTAVAGTTLSAVTIAVEDTFGNVLTSDTSTVTLTLNTGTFSTGSSTVTATASSGIATFSSLAVNTTGSYQITASDSGSSVTASPTKNLSITPAALSSLVVAQNPTTGTAGVAFNPAVKVEALDAYGNLLTASTMITLTLTGANFSTGSNTATATASRGLATFSSLIIDTAGTYSLTASVGSIASSSFSLTVSPNVAKNPTWSSAPQSTAVAGATLSTIVVNVPDAYGNLVTAATTVTLKLTTGKFSTGSSTVTATSSNGVATFSGLSITTTGNYTLTAVVGSMSSTASNLTVSPAAANQLVFTTAPKASAIAGATLNNVVVAVEDTYGNIVTTDLSSVTLTLSSGTFSTGSATVTVTVSGGVASFSNLAINTTGTYTITASDSLLSITNSNVKSLVSSVTSVTSGNLVITPSVLSSLVISQSPSTGTAGVALAPAVVVQALDAFGNLLSASTSVTLKLSSGKFSTGGTSATAAAVSGVATFSNLIFNTSGNYTLTATVGSLSSSSFNVTISPAAASKLAWQSSPPTTAVAGATLSSVAIAVEDTYGNVVTSDSSTVTLTLNTGTFSTGSSTVTATASSGIATFNSLAINVTGSYQISVSDSGSATTTTIKSLAITPSSLSSLVITQNPTTETAGVTFNPAVKVEALDAYGNLLTASTTITLTLTGANFSTGSNTATATASRGLASFSGLIINTAGTYTLAASVGSVTSSSFSLTVSPNVARQVVWQTAPSATAVAGATLNSIVVAVEDAYGNLVTTSSTVTLKLTGGQFSSGSTTVTATSTNGVATFGGLSINTAGNYTLTASVGSMTTGASSMTISAATSVKTVSK